MNKQHNAETLGLAMRIMHDESVASSTRLSVEQRAMILAHADTGIRSLVEKGSTRALKSAMKAMARDLRHDVYPDVLDRIRLRVEAETGIAWSEIADDGSAVVARILKRGSIKTVAEFRILRDHLDHLEGDPQNSDAIAEAARLLDTFDTGRGTARRS